MGELRGFVRSQQTNQLFSSYSYSIVQGAEALRTYLAANLSKDWQEADATALLSWSEFEYDLENLPVIGDFGTDDQCDAEVDEFLGLRHIFHTALPFSEAERAWFLKINNGNNLPPMEDRTTDLPRVIGSYEEHIVSAGVRQTVSGSNLIRRWLAWRQEVGEYADQGTRDIATSALGQLATLFSSPN